MDSRREFLKKAALLSGAAGFTSVLPPSIQRAFAIDPDTGTTYLDAEHVVILMQENRSFDHCYGSLQGVRGFNDPRAIRLPDKNRVWLQTNANGETYSPFRLNIKDTKATWMGSLPHSWTDQVDAGNNGRHDQWLEAKKPGNKEYGQMPLTLGYYNREDLPFYYSLADAFTVCDQNFCSSLTGTTPNRLYLWTGTIRDQRTFEARVRNEQLDYDREADWKTFPERLEENNVSWKIYQNEISVGVGFDGEQDSWLANFTDNPIEWFSQYNVRFLPAYVSFLPEAIRRALAERDKLEEQLKTAQEGTEESVKLKKQLAAVVKRTDDLSTQQRKYNARNFAKLSQKDKNLHSKAFTTNVNDPFYHQLTTLKYKDGIEEREMQIPKGDVLHQFREDVKNKKLPTVSWLVAPENFSDHPGAPWYGAWYLSEAMDILTKNPEVWKKTIFILCYDENDGYFDHIPPFAPPVQGKPETGLASKTIDTSSEHVTLQQDMKLKPEKYARESPIGLGYRVPLVVASPWSRGGSVCSQVFDHTSILQFLEKFLSHKTGKKIEETNITTWRRTVCGDLTSVFKPYQGEKTELPKFVQRTEFIESIHKAKFKGNPSGYRKLTEEDIDVINNKPSESQYMPRQEKGSRSSCALPYELFVDGKLSDDKKTFSITFEARNVVLGAKSAGAPFQVYSIGKEFNVRHYAVAPGDRLIDSLPIDQFENGAYHFAVYGPNGFFREFSGTIRDAALDVRCEYPINKKQQYTGNVEIILTNRSSKSLPVEISDKSYGQPAQTKTIGVGKSVSVIADLAKSQNWYDLVVNIAGNDTFKYQFAGRVETGKMGVTDPLIN
jgi:phospholipase C